MPPEELRVEIAAEHIRAGEPRDAVYDPLKLALQDLGYRRVEVREAEVGIDDTWYNLDPDAQEWLRQFDAGQSVGPVWFTLRRRETP